MKINEQGLTGAYNSATAATGRNQWVGGGLGVRGTGNRSDFGLDRVEVSETAEAISSVLALHAAQREAEIASLEAEVKSGRYRIDDAALSRAILSEAMIDPQW